MGVIVKNHDHAAGVAVEQFLIDNDRGLVETQTSSGINVRVRGSAPERQSSTEAGKNTKRRHRGKQEA